MTGPDQGTLSDPRAQIANEVLRVHQDSYGTGAGDVTVHLLKGSVVVLLDALELTTMEKALIDGGRGEKVRRTRPLYEETIGSTYMAIVERATGRRVTSFLSNMSLESLYSVEVFRTAG